MKKKPLTDLIRFRAPLSLKKRLAGVAAREGLDASDICRRALLRTIEEAEAALGLSKKRV